MKASEVERMHLEVKRMQWSMALMSLSDEADAYAAQVGDLLGRVHNAEASEVPRE